MKVYSKWAITVAIILASVMGLAMATAQAGTRFDKVAALNPSAANYKYLCQKKDKYGEWQTVKVCDNEDDAKEWFDKQPDNARIAVVAQK